MSIAKYLQNSDKSLHISLKDCPHPPKKNPLQTSKTRLSSLKPSGGEGERKKKGRHYSTRSTVDTTLSELHIEITTKISSDGKLQ